MKSFFNYLKILVSFAILALLLWLMRGKFENIIDILFGANKPIVILCFILFLAAAILQAYRLKFLMAAQEIHLDIKEVVCLSFVGQFFNNVMPTAIGGDIVKAYYASTATKKKLEAFASVVMDRIIGAIILVWLAMIVLIVRYDQLQSKIIVVITASMFVFMTSLAVLILNKKIAKKFSFLRKIFKKFKIEEKIQRLYIAANKYRHHKILVLHTLWLSLLSQLMFFFIVYLLAMSIDSKLSFVSVLLTMPVISAMSMLPSLNGLGIREGGFVYFIGMIIGKEKAFVLSLLYLGVSILPSILIGGPIFLLKRKYNSLPEKSGGF